MRRIHISALIALVVLFSFAAASAQPTTQPEDGGRGAMLLDRLKQIAGDLKLTPEQQTKIDSILDDARQQLHGMIDELRQSDPETRRQRIQQFLENLHDKFKEVLTSEQVQTFEQKLQELRNEMRAATTQPAGGMMMPRLRNALGQLELTPDQKQKVESVLQDTRQRMQDLRAEMQSDDSQMREKIQSIMQDTRQQLRDILTPEQREKLRSLMPGPGGGPPPSQNAPPPATQPTPQTDASPPPPTTRLRVGQKAPDFALQRLDGQNVQLSSFKGKILLLVFGSYSSPIFREHAEAIEQLRREYLPRVNFLIIYTRENYPAGQWDVERNKQEDVLVPEHTDMNARMVAAREARDRLKLTVPILLDSMDNKTAGDYDGFSNAAVLIGRDGTVLFSQKWFEPYALRAAIDEMLKNQRNG
jgi:Spy/CpxP family protein refolding chaperone